MSVECEIPLGVECALPPTGGSAMARKRRWLVWIGAALALGYALQYGGDVLGVARRPAGQELLERAWQRTLAGEGNAALWPWAASRPVAKLTVPSQDVQALVVSGEPLSDEVAAPVHLPGTPLPGEPGNSVIGDRDGSALGFLRRANLGDRLDVQRPDRATIAYRITDIEIIDKRDVWIVKDEGPTRLTMITCYPFDAQCASHRQRYAVIARAVPSPEAARER